ncbi:MAG: nitrogen regulation protein NR(II) [Gemmatimonadota bacterium]
MVLSSRSNRRAAAALQPARVLYWIYAWRLVICLAVYGSAVLVGDVWVSRFQAGIPPETRLVAILGLAAAAVFTPLAYWHSHRRHHTPGQGFLYGQALLDVVLTTGIVHITGGSQSPFPPLFYIALSAGYALLLPFGSAVLVALCTGFAYLVDISVAYPEQMSGFLLLQIAIFMVVASGTSVIGARLRQVRQELRSVEGELQRLRLDTADILRTLSSGVVTLDGEGNVAYMNLAAADLLGLRVEEWLGRGLLPELDRRAPDVAAAVRETLETSRKVRNREAQVYPGDGAVGSGAPAGPDAPAGGIAVAVSTSLLLRSDAPPSLILLLQDLSMARQVEHLRLRAGRLEAVAELSASLAHEIRNPLASIRSAVEQLCARKREDDDDRVLSRLIVRESDRLGAILSEFGDFARVNVARREPIDVRQLLTEVVEVARQHPSAEGRATFNIEIAAGLEGLWGDPELLHATIFNLVLNAIQVGDPSKTVHVRLVADSLKPDGVPHETALGLPVRIRVIDDGPGIAPEDVARIFDPFFTRRQGGSGLGLSIAHRAIQAHGGVLMPSSPSGRGATFAVVLPRRDFRRRNRLRLDVQDAASGRIPVTRTEES